MHQNLQHRLRELRERRNTDEGFTLIELLVVVVIIGVLVAIAIPVYLNYTEGAQNKSAQSDVRGAIGAVENFYIQNGNNLPNVTTAVAGGLTLSVTPAPAGVTVQPGKITVSEGNTVAYKKGTAANASTYIICGQNKDGRKIYYYNSNDGGSVKEMTTQTTVAGCTGTLT